MDHVINLEPAFKLQYGRIYNHSEFKSRTLKAYIETNLANGVIQQSSSSAAASILFDKDRMEDYSFVWNAGISTWGQSRAGTPYL